MKPVDMIILTVIAVVVGLVIRFLCKAKKRGVRCIGCPEGAKCANCSGNCCAGTEN